VIAILGVAVVVMVMMCATTSIQEDHIYGRIRLSMAKVVAKPNWFRLHPSDIRVHIPAGSLVRSPAGSPDQRYSLGIIRTFGSILAKANQVEGRSRAAGSAQAAEDTPAALEVGILVVVGSLEEVGSLAAADILAEGTLGDVSFVRPSDWQTSVK
jgi:hypothetical protein